AALTTAPVVPANPAPARAPARPVSRPARRPAPRASVPARSSARPTAAARLPEPAPSLPPAPLPEGDRPAVPVELKGYVSVRARPWGTLASDAVMVGATPRLDLPVAAGTHTLRITRDGYAPLETTITLAAGERRVVTGLVLKELAP